MTGIQWTEAVWNPTTGCDRVSPGCDHCYAMTMAKRLKGMGSAKYQNDGAPGTSGPGFGLTTHEDTLTLPLRWRKPRRIFVNSMSDLFHDKVTDDFIRKVFAVMAATPQHTYQVLTKRHGRMRTLLNNPGWRSSVFQYESVLDLQGPPRPLPSWPLLNVWLGVSVENQQWAGIRIPALLDTPAAVRWLSCEPLLGPVDLGIGDPHRDHESDDVHGYPHPRICLTCSPDEENEVEYFRREADGGGLDWVVVGGESGSGARPMELAWARSLVEQCQQAKVPVFVKQLGSVWAGDATWNGGPVSREDKKGGEPFYWPADLRVREYPAEVGTLVAPKEGA